MLNHSTGAGTHPHKVRGADLYETHPAAVCALLKVEKLPHRIWEPACGPGSIVQVLKNAGHMVIASDKHWYGGVQDYHLDFIGSDCCHMVCHTECVLTNPPYKYAQQFVERALNLGAPLVVMLLRLLESKRRSEILDTGVLSRVHVFANRLPMMHRHGWQGKKASSAMAFAWFVWDKNHKGPTTIDRISWEQDNG